MAWNVKEVEVTDSLIGEFAVSIKVRREDGNWWLTGVYGPNDYRKRGNVF